MQNCWHETHIFGQYIRWQLDLRNAQHVLNIRHNLVSTGMLDDKGYQNVQGEGKWKHSKGNLIIARGKKQSTLYLMQAKLGKEDVNAVHDSSLQTFVRKQFLLDFRGNALKFCVDYIYEKQHKVAFQNISPSRKLNSLELVHIDIYHMKDESLGSAIYFVTFINDFARKFGILL